MSNPDSKPDIGVCTLCLKEKPVFRTYKPASLKYWIHFHFIGWIRTNVIVDAIPDVITCSDCFEAWVQKDTSYLNMCVLKQKLLR